MAGRIWIGPYKPLGVSTQAVPGGGYLNIDATAGQFGGSILGSLGRHAADGAAGIATSVSEHLANDNEAVIKAADVRLGEAEQTLLFDPRNGYLNTQGQTALTHAPAVLDAYRGALDRELSQTTDDDQRQMLQGLNERRLASFTTLVERHTETERQRWYDEAGERRIAQMQADARLHWRDDAQLRRALGTARFEVRETAERKGWDASLTEAALRQHTSRVLVAAIEGAVERDPDRAQAVRTRYDRHIEAADQAALDALLVEAQTRRRAEAASAAILNATPPDGESSAPQWRLRQAEAITEPAVRAATIRRLTSVATAAEARARALAERVLERVLKDGLTDTSQIPVREWVNLDAERRQAIETRLDHNAAGTEPAPNPALVDDLATEMTEAPHAFARRDLVPPVARLPLPHWQRFRDWQAGIRRNDSTTKDEAYAIRRGLQLAQKMPLANSAEASAELIEEIHTWRRINGRSPSDAEIIGMLDQHLRHTAFAPNTPKVDPYHLIAGPNLNPPWPPGLEWLFALRGHHFIPQSVYKSLGVPPEALRVFRQATTGPLMPKTHSFDDAHRQYNRVVAEVVDRWIKRNGIDPKQMTAAQARALVGHVLNHRHPVIRRYHEILAKSAALKAARRAKGID